MPADGHPRPTEPVKTRRRRLGAWLIRLGRRLGGEAGDAHPLDPFQDAHRVEQAGIGGIG